MAAPAREISNACAPLVSTLLVFITVPSDGRFYTALDDAPEVDAGCNRGWSLFLEAGYSFWCVYNFYFCSDSLCRVPKVYVESIGAILIDRFMRWLVSSLLSYLRHLSTEVYSRSMFTFIYNPPF